MSSIEDPLIQVNWSKIGNYLNIGLSLVKKLGEEIIKLILKLLIALLLGFRQIWLKTRNFAKSKQKGYWILFLIGIIVFMMLFLNKHLIAEQRKYQELKQFYEEQIKRYQDLQEKQGELEKKLEETEKKIQVYNSKKQIVITNWKSKELTPETKAIIKKYATNYGIDISLGECIILHESGGNPNAVGDVGEAVGVAQYHLGTFLSHRRQMGLSTIDLRRNSEASIQTMTWAIAKGLGGAWTTFTRCN